MAKQTVDIGTGPGVGDGDPLRVAFDKINQNFTEIYAGNVAISGNVVTVSTVNGKAGPTVNLTVSDISGAVSSSQFQQINAINTKTSTVPLTSKGQTGDVVGMVAMDSTYFYYCAAAYDGTTDIWKRVANNSSTW